jgi:hypothetical protein
VAAGWLVDVYMTTYDPHGKAPEDTKIPQYSEVPKPIDPKTMEGILRSYPGLKDIFYQPETSRQVDTFVEGLRKVPDDYDLYMITRFDFNYKKPISEWMPKDYIGDANKVWVLWREIEYLWNSSHRVSDSIHFTTRAGKKSLQDVLDAHKSPGAILSGDFHQIYDILIQKAEIGFIVDGFYDSNTSGKGAVPITKNPIYIMNKRTYHHNNAPPENACD